MSIDDVQPMVPASDILSSIVRKKITSCAVCEPLISLTFDDSPEQPTSGALLDALKKYKIAATFFVLGEKAARLPEFIRRMHAEGHSVGNHGWDHTSFRKLNPLEIQDQVWRTDEMVEKLLGIRPTLLRPPYGVWDDHFEAGGRMNFNHSLILWSVDPQDWKNQDARTISEHVVKNSNAGAIVLAHDGFLTTIKALPQMIEGLLGRGFRFVTVPQMLSSTANMKDCALLKGVS